MSEILDKYLKGELSKEAYEAEVEKLSDEDKQKHNDEVSKPETKARIKQAADEELARVDGLRKERQRLESAPPREGQTDYATQLRKENVKKASERFFKQFKVPAESQAAYLEKFEKSGSEHVDSDLIFGDFERIYVSENSSELLDQARRFQEMQEGAEDFNAMNAGPAGGSGDGGDSEKKFSQAAHEFVKEAAKQGRTLKLEDAERVLQRGMTRKF